MAKDYARYIIQDHRRRRHRPWIKLILFTGLLIVGLGALFVRSPHKHHKTPDTAHKSQQGATNSLTSASPNPKFDFYNILPQGSPLSPTQSQDRFPSPGHRQADMSDTNNDSTTPLKSPPSNLINTSPEQFAMAEAKRLLDREMNRLSKDVYILVLGNFQQADRAEQYQAQMLLKGFPAKSKLGIIHGHTTHQLFMGPYTGLALAVQHQRGLNAAGIKPTLIRKESAHA